MSSAVIDANIAINCVLPAPLHTAALELMERLVRQEVELCVPHLWLAEIATGLRETTVAGHISPESGALALEAALNLPVAVIPEDAGVCRRAFWWAGRLEQNAVYDAIYLALAEQLGADFHTADRRLYQRCQALKLPFVKFLESA